MAFSSDIRSRNLFWINVSTFSWTLGLGASIPVVPLLAYQFLPDLALAGLVVAIGGAGRLFSGYLTGPLVDRFGRRGVSIVGITVRMVFSFLEGLSGSYLSLVLARFFSSIGTAIYGTSVSVMMADLATRRDRGSIAGGRSSLSQLGNVLGPVVGGALWAWSGDLRAPFLFNGFTKLVCLIIFVFFVKETRHFDAEQSAAAGHQAAPAPAATPSTAAVAAASAPAPAPPHVSLKEIMLTGPFFLTLYATFAATLFQQGIQYTVLAVYVKDVLHLPASDIGLVLSSISAGQLLVSFPAGRMVDRWGIKSGIVPGAVIAAAALGFLAVTSWATVIWGFVMGCGTGLLMVTAQAYAMDLAPRGGRGHFFGVNQTAQSSANLFGPLLVGFIADHLNYNWSFAAVAIVLAAVIPMGLVWVREVAGTGGARARVAAR